MLLYLCKTTRERCRDEMYSQNTWARWRFSGKAPINGEGAQSGTRSESSVTTYTFKDDKVKKDSRHESWSACCPITDSSQVASRLNRILQGQLSDEFFLARCGLCIIYWHPAKLQWPQSLIGPLIISVRRSISTSTVFILPSKDKSFSVLQYFTPCLALHFAENWRPSEIHCSHKHG